MKPLFYILCILLALPTLLRAQHFANRTAEDIANKQTEMLVRELHISDSVVRDTLFRMHLKFARKHMQSHTRADAMQYMQEANDELKNILTPEQYQQFMNQQVNHAPHRQQMHYNRIHTTAIDTTALSPSASEETHIPPTPGWPQSPVRL